MQKRVENLEILEGHMLLGSVDARSTAHVAIPRHRIMGNSLRPPIILPHRQPLAFMPPPKLVYQRLLCTANNPAVFIGTSKVLQRYPHIQPSCESCYPWKVVQEKRLVLHGHRHQTWTAYGDHNTLRLGGLFDRHGFVRSSGLRNILLQRHTYPIDY
jgi:hypothetical protein